MRFKLWLSSAVFAATPLVAQAQVGASLPSASTQIYTNIGTQGVGIGMAKPVNASMDIRIGVSAANLKKSGSGDSLNVDVGLSLQNLGVYADYFPFQSGGFRLTAGMQFGKNSVKLHAKPNASNEVTVNGKTYGYGPSDNISGALNMGNSAPYIGLGYSSHNLQKPGLGVNFDVGIRAGKADVTLISNGFANLPTAEKAQLDADLKLEREKIANDLKILKTYPVIALGLNYRW